MRDKLNRQTYELQQHYETLMASDVLANLAGPRPVSRDERPRMTGMSPIASTRTDKQNARSRHSIAAARQISLILDNQVVRMPPPPGPQLTRPKMPIAH